MILYSFIKKSLRWLQMELFSPLWQLFQKRTDLNGFIKYFIKKELGDIFAIWKSMVISVQWSVSLQAVRPVNMSGRY